MVIRSFGRDILWIDGQFRTSSTGCYSSLDQDGTELPDIYTAQAQAIRFSGEILRAMGAKFWNGTAWRLEVADARGQILFVIRFSAEERPAGPVANSDVGRRMGGIGPDFTLC